MWVLLSIVMALGLFGLLSLTHMEQDENATFQVAQSVMETQSAQQMDSFTAAAWAYATANNVSTGATISVTQLVNAGYLPTAFTASNPFGQMLVALTGNNTLAAYYQNPPSTLYGMPIVPRTEKGVAMKMAEKLSAMQENAPQYVSAISDNGGTGAYTQALLPYAATALTMSTNDPQFSTAFPSLLNLVNVLPATALESGGGTSATASALSTAPCNLDWGFITPGTYQISAPSCASSVSIVADGAGGGFQGGQGSYGSSVSETLSVSSGQEYTVIVGGASTSFRSLGGGGLSALCVGSACSVSSVMVVAGGGGGAYPPYGDAGTANNSTNDLQNGGTGFGGNGDDAWYGYGTPATPFGQGGVGGAGNGGYGGGGGYGTGPSNATYPGGGGGFPGGAAGYGGTDYVGGGTNSSISLGSGPGANGSVNLTFIH